ncbi:hypothetical protein O3M35_003204 [Rhynocoris fuscipes]|uniref:Uncharacterized protein n=1 Tax=Rhynocoris fuscipes TaxID=488301 RepID=A0AAW1CM97_9HEMI
MESSTESAHCREPVPFTVKGPVPIFLNELYAAKTGCSSIDIILTTPGRVREILFRNYYVANIGLLLIKGNESKPYQWQPAIQKKILMPNAHLENCSQDIFSILATESAIDWNNVLMFRLILRQPSQMWGTFKLEEINLFADLPRFNTTPSLPSSPHCEYSRMLEMIKKQTKAALMYSSQVNTSSNTSSGSKCEPRQACGYEIVKLSQV